LKINFSNSLTGVNFKDVFNLLNHFHLTDLSEDKIKQAFINSYIVVFIYDEEDNNKLIGCGRAISDTVAHASIFKIALLEDYHNLGIGKQLINNLTSRLENQIITLYTHPNTLGFYQKCGFVPLHTALVKFRDHEIIEMKNMKFID
jgi:ribosomal protein S18 acetylase RimI-like enzyme